MTKPTNDLREICAQLDREPLLHASLGSRELFHSNFLAWFVDRHREAAREVFESWTRAASGVPAARTEREWRHLDLVIHLEGLAPLVVENKVFSPPHDAQLEGYADDVGDRFDPEPEFALLSLSDPAWPGDERSLGGYRWRYHSYGTLGTAMNNAASAIDDDYERETIVHYGHVASLLQQAAEIVAVTIDDATPFAIPEALASELEPIRLDQGFEKLRTRSIAHYTQDNLAEQGLDVTVVDGYGRTWPMLEVFTRVPSTDDEIGWQLQERQWRLAARVLPSHRLYGRDDALRSKREHYLADRYSDWFDFTPVDQVLGTTLADSPKRDGFKHFKPDFVYKYRKVEEVTAGQLCELATLLARRSREFGPTTQPSHSPPGP